MTTYFAPGDRRAHRPPGHRDRLRGLGRGRRLRRQGHEVYPFHLGDLNLPTPRTSSRRLRGDQGRQDRLLPERRHPGAARGPGRRRRRLARPAYAAENVAIQPGGKPVIGKFMLALMNPGDEVLYPNPGFPIYESQIEFHGGVAVPYGYLEGDDGFVLDLEALEAAITPRTRLLDLQRPAEPHGRRVLAGGARAPRRARPQARPHGALRRGLLRHPLRGPSRSLASLPGMAERSVILYTFSKKFAMTGWRLGAAIGPREVDRGDRQAQRQRRVAAPTTSSSTAPSRGSPATRAARGTSSRSCESGATRASRS